MTLSAISYIIGHYLTIERRRVATLAFVQRPHFRLGHRAAARERRACFLDDACAHPGATDRRPFRGSCPWPRRANAISPARTRRCACRWTQRTDVQRHRDAAPPYRSFFGGAGEFPVIPCSGENFPVPATKIPCSGCTGKLVRGAKVVAVPRPQAGWSAAPSRTT